MKFSHATNVFTLFQSYFQFFREILQLIFYTRTLKEGGTLMNLTILILTFVKKIHIPETLRGAIQNAKFNNVQIKVRYEFPVSPKNSDYEIINSILILHRCNYLHGLLINVYESWQKECQRFPGTSLKTKNNTFLIRNIFFSFKFNLLLVIQ